MIGNVKEKTRDQLTLRSQLSELARIPAWVADLRLRHSISENVQFAIDICLEEALSNVIRYGYAGTGDGRLVVSFAAPRERYFEFVVEDEAPRFNPLEELDLPALKPNEEIRVGGQGIRLLRQFADAIEYERTSTGNRLRLGFSDSGSTDRPRL
jgi:serine/threonine-protein kinase RsbW